MFTHTWVCRWDHVDLAQRAYFPRLINAMHQAGEAYMEAIGWPYQDNPSEHGFMLPIVETGSSFERAVEAGDRIDIEVVVEYGTASLRLEFTGRNDAGEVAFTGFEQHVCIPAGEDQSMPLPEAFRAAIDEGPASA